MLIVFYVLFLIFNLKCYLQPEDKWFINELSVASKGGREGGRERERERERRKV